MSDQEATLKTVCLWFYIRYKNDYTYKVLEQIREIIRVSEIHYCVTGSII